ncbi:sugar phosphate isomerase/epimerase family protein [Swaminathania salitolerans]|uniref:Epimerase n=1 Tax=Swaminathania salitolerans TaxID=182838 RepID=A0A511BRC6_9PROT|nr:sugar phosphate isomerase/epimerase family protein [Swaminathania salitolerans]GBQ11231.1 sugar phosphate isomerase/epimerase [Swaminathania salitolerans LMG 21291]GEL02393.1 epimerase [Swaminathania salitolerans]
MNKLGLHAFVWTPHWTPDDAAKAIEATAALGYDLIEVSTMDLAAFDVASTLRELERNRLGVTMSFGLTAGMDISSEDADCVRRGEAHLLDAVSLARDLGATHVCGILYSAFRKYETPTTEAGLRNSVAVMRKVAGKAQASGITLGMEVVNRYESNVLNTARQAIAYVRRVDMPNVKLHLDCYHMNIEEADPAEAIREAGSLLGYFHTGESHRGYLGSGSIAFSRIFRALNQIAYEGPITFESFSSAVVGQPLEGILGIWRDLWTDGYDLAAHARAFTEVQIKSAREAAALRVSS